MPCEHCCGADRLFDLGSAKKELKKYQKKGPRSATRKLIGLLKSEDLAKATMLEVGGGIGAISWHFLEHGAATVTDVDASSGYIETARNYADTRGWSDKCTFVFGDLTEAAHSIPSHDFLSMDKIICCYPDYKVLLETALSKCKQTFIVSYPVDDPVSGFLNRLVNLYMWIRKNPYRSYIHPVKEIRQTIHDLDFRLIGKDRSLQWHLELYKRN